MSEITKEELIEKCMNSMKSQEFMDLTYTNSGKLFPDAFYRLRKSQIEKAIPVISQEIREELEAQSYIGAIFSESPHDSVCIDKSLWDMTFERWENLKGGRNGQRRTD